MTDPVKNRRPSPLQRRVLIVLAALGAKRPGPVATRDIEQVLEESGEAPVYGPNLRASCRRLEAAGLLRTLRAPNLQLAVELTGAGRELATPLLAAEREAATARRRETTVSVLAQRPGTANAPVPVALDGHDYDVIRGDFVVHLNGATVLRLTLAGGRWVYLDGDALQVAGWYHQCLNAGVSVGVQVNEGE